MRVSLRGRISWRWNRDAPRRLPLFDKCIRRHGLLQFRSFAFQAPSLVEAVNRAQLWPEGDSLVLNNPRDEKRVAPDPADRLNFHLSHSQGEIGDWNAERGRLCRSKRKVFPGD